MNAMAPVVAHRSVVDEQRIDAQSQLESELKRSLTSTEALIFERGFITGSIHGVRDCRAELAKTARKGAG